MVGLPQAARQNAPSVSGTMKANIILALRAFFICISYQEWISEEIKDLHRLR